MRVLHIVKTSAGAEWAALQARELVRLGVDVHAALPDLQGRMVQCWRESGATLHVAALDFPLHRPWLLPGVYRAARRLVDAVSPALIQTHHLGPTLVLRRALGESGPLRIFQVPGPLHLEHWPYRKAEISCAGECDFWIGTSRRILRLYREAGIPPQRVFLSYNSTEPRAFCTERTNALRDRLGIGPEQKVVGNISFIYPPKFLLGQRIGLKAHEHLIDALSLVTSRRPDVTGVLLGGTWGNRRGYEERLRARAKAGGQGRILMPGFVPHAEIQRVWADFDCAIHVPLSENCGGVVEPLAAGVPTIAGRVGGLPEVVMDGLTGCTVPIRNPALLANAILEVLAKESHYRRLAENGRRLVETMFDVRRTAAEVHAIYHHLLDRSSPPPAEFDSMETARIIAEQREISQARN
jgi:glycosyltransferase involved in cell wall biosynthesis